MYSYVLVLYIQQTLLHKSNRTGTSASHIMRQSYDLFSYIYNVLQTIHGQQHFINIDLPQSPINAIQFTYLYDVLYGTKF